jgi:hypothetical protein
MKWRLLKDRRKQKTQKEDSALSYNAQFIVKVMGTTLRRKVLFGQNSKGAPSGNFIELTRYYLSYLPLLLL